MEQKPDYIHQNLVFEGLVVEPVHHIYNSARDFAGNKGLMAVNILD